MAAVTICSGFRVQKNKVSHSASNSLDPLGLDPGRQGSLMCCSPRDCKESDTTEQQQRFMKYLGHIYTKYLEFKFDWMSCFFWPPQPQLLDQGSLNFGLWTKFNLLFIFVNCLIGTQPHPFIFILYAMTTTLKVLSILEADMNTRLP